MINIYNNFEAIEDYRHDWNLLAAMQNLPTLSFEWFQCCAQAFHKNDELILICIVNDNELVATAPLYRSHNKNEGHILQLLGSQRLYEPGGLLFSNVNSLRLLFKAFKLVAYPVFLNRCYHELDLASFSNKLSINGLIHAIPATGSQYLELNNDFERFEIGLSSKRRYDLRRALRKAQTLGPVNYRILHPNIENIKDHLTQALSIENSGWKQHSGSSIEQNSDLVTFFLCHFKKAAENNTAVIGFLNIDGKPIACNLAICQFNRLWILKIGHEDEYNSCSPGILLIHKMIDYAYTSELKGFEFLGCDEQWIEFWRPRKRTYVSYLYYPLSYKGLKGLLKDSLSLIKRKFHQMIKH